MRNALEDLLGIEPRSKRTNGKVKGANNERVLCKVMERWVGVPFARVPASGGLRWRESVNTCGDIICQRKDFDFPFSVETKFYSNFDIIPKIHRRSKVMTFFSQCLADSQRAKQCPFLAIRKNGMGKSKYVIYLDFKVEELEVVAEGQGLYSYNSEEFFNFEYTKFIEKYDNQIRRPR